MIKKFASIAAIASLAACGNQGSDTPLQKADDKVEEKQSSEIADLYIRIRKLAAAGELETAASLTDNPQAYLAQMNMALERMGDVSFSENMEEAALPANIHSEETSGDFVMLVVKYTYQDKTDLAATFFRKLDTGYREMVAHSDDIPCDLVKEFYETRGDAEYEISDCTPTAKPGQKAA